MPFAQLADVRLHYELQGDPNLPALMLCNSLGTTLDMWAPQMPAFLACFRVLRYDTRGHGQSEVTPGEYSIPSSAPTPWRCSTAWASTACRSAACRWAA
jgi:3-oxoadipate enol-lactonase